MRKWLLAWAATELTLARLARRFSPPALPGNAEAFVVSQVRGVWRRAVDVPGRL